MKTFVSGIVIIASLSVRLPEDVGTKTGVWIESVYYAIVDYHQAPSIEIVVTNYETTNQAIRITIDTYENNYYLYAQSFSEHLQYRSTYHYPLFHFNRNQQTYHLVIRLWRGNQAVQNLILPIHSSLESQFVVNHENRRISEPIGYEMNANGQIDTIYQISDFTPIFDQTRHPIPVIPIEDFWFTIMNQEGISIKEVYFVMEGGFGGSEIDFQDGKYYFPLNVINEYNRYDFELATSYYFDKQQGVMLKHSNDNSIKTTKIILSLDQQQLTSAYGQIYLSQVGVNHSNYILDIQFQFSKQVFGRCDNALICVRRVVPLPHVIYRQTGK